MESTPSSRSPLPGGPARLLLKAVVLAGAVTFLVTVMVNACARPPEAFYPTKAAPVMRPSNDDAIQQAPARQVQPAPRPRKPARRYMPATKSGSFMSPDGDDDVPEQAPGAQKPAK